MWDKLLAAFLRRLVQRGHLVVIGADGTMRRFGDPAGVPVTVRLHDRAAARRLLLNPELALGEAYMDGALSVDGDDLYALLELLVVNLKLRRGGWTHELPAAWRRLSRGLAQYNPVGRARRNAAHHYDLSSDFYQLFLDADRQYSCAYFRDGNDSLEAAQQAKKELIASKLLLKPGQRVLDIGCGWGGLGLHLAGRHGADVTGITLSQEQHRVAERRAAEAGLARRARFRLQDYREMEGRFDRIVSVGMFEHVGVPHYDQYFELLRERLSDEGVALVHTIGRTDGPGATNAWIAKYIFPGGYCPALSEMLAAVERSGLVVTDVEVWRLHYADTLRAWRQRFEAKLDQVRQIYDERFCRMWRFYLVACEIAFRHNDHVVFQLQIAKRQDAVPRTRDYLFDEPRQPAEISRAA
jgi:cyclopropane-fatty-acyl-phospholipid synthase